MTFQIKSIKELEELSNNELGSYYAEKSRAEMKELVESKTADIEKTFQGSLEEANAKIATLKDSLKSQGEALASKSGVLIPGADFDWISEGLKMNKANLSNLKDKNPNGAFSMDFTKVAGDMTIAGNVLDPTLFPIPEYIPGFNRIQRRSNWISNIINVASTNRNSIHGQYQVNPDGTAGVTAEAAPKNKIDFDLKTQVRNVSKYTDYIRVSDEALDDIDFMRSEIQNELLERLRLSVDSDQLVGDGVAKLTGLLTDATAFAAGPFATTVPEANEVDVLTVAINQIMLANFNPNVILMNPSDVTAMKLGKASDGHYSQRLLVSGLDMTLDGIPIIANTGMAQDTFLVMDSSKATIYNRQPVNIVFGMNGNDFTENMQTVRAEWRGVQVVRGNDNAALVTGVFSTAKAAILAP